MKIGKTLIKCPYCDSTNIDEQDSREGRYYYLTCLDCLEETKEVGSFTVYNKNKSIVYIDDEGYNIFEILKRRDK